VSLAEYAPLPKVSIIIPVYNGERYIRGCLEHLLAQRYPPEKLEILSVDNNSTDRTIPMIESLGLQWITAVRQGPGAARNAAMRIASGELLVMIDADCLADKDLIIRHVLAHIYFGAVDPQVKLIGGGIQGLNTNFWSVCDDFCSWASNHPALPAGFVKSHPTANLSIHRSLIEEGYFFDEELRSGEDYDFCIRVTRNGYKIFFEPQAIVAHINRRTFSGFMKHPKEWTQSEYRLRQKGITVSLQSGVLKSCLIYCIIFWKITWKTFFYSLCRKKLSIVLVAPWIILNRFYFCFQLLLVDLKFSKQQPRRTIN
jgi:glycosyltransferase involved in cell wall biosynthesis